MLGQKMLIFLIFLDYNLLKNSDNWNQYPQTCEKASRATQKVSILEL